MSLVIADNTANKDQPLTVTADKLTGIWWHSWLSEEKTYFRMAFKKGIKTIVSLPLAGKIDIYKISIFKSRFLGAFFLDGAFVHQFCG